MPPKKSTGGQKAVVPDPTVLPDGGDPALVAMAIVDKKKRNLEKRKNKLESLKEGLDSGTRLDTDQIAAVAKLNDVSIQLELIKELQKQFTTLQSDFQKSRKRQQKADRLAARESEKEAERKAVVYTLRIQDLLTNMGDEDKDNFRTGTNGALLLSESELFQLDEVYGILTPSRQANPSYADDLERASEFIQQIIEQSGKEALGSTYKQLYELFQKIEGCGYFDRPASDTGDDEEEGVADDEDYRSAEDNLTPANEETGSYERSTPVGEEIMEPLYAPPTEIQQELEPVIQPDMLTGYTPSAPSPTFPGLGPSPVQPIAGDGFSFMHDSEVDRGSLQAISQPPTTLDSTHITPSLLPTSPDPQRPAPPMAYSQYPQTNERLATEDMSKLSIVGPGGDIIPHPASTTVNQSGAQSDLAATDVATGQPNQSTNAYQGGGLINSATPPVSYHYGGVAMGDASSGYPSQLGAPVRVSEGQPRGGRGNRRGGGPGQGGPKNSGGMYRNGRGMQGGYDNMGGYATNNRGYSTAGGAVYPRGGGSQNGGGGGRANYRTNNAPQGTRK
ncbi:caprin-1-like isoform X2 [Halichondria panicea]|uniref:caprin-1-like isoform X2 n=1 Tax=Halichondria panicea TaxID=6063 RepID=UPI00312BA61E